MQRVIAQTRAALKRVPNVALFRFVSAASRVVWRSFGLEAGVGKLAWLGWIPISAAHSFYSSCANFISAECEARDPTVTYPPSLPAPCHFHINYALRNAKFDIGAYSGADKQTFGGFMVWFRIQLHCTCPNGFWGGYSYPIHY